MPEHFDWYDVQYEKLEKGLQPFMTIDGGHSWNLTPKSATRVIMLNFETVIISISHNLSAIIYSFDKGTTWLSHGLLPKNSGLHYFGQLSDSDLSVLIVTRNSQTKELRFDILDFSNIFRFSVVNLEFDCGMKHFLHVPLPRSRRLCHRGQNINIITRDANIFCSNKFGQYTYVESLCPCSSEDFVCDFNFQLKDGLCVLDPLSNITDTPLAREKEFQNDIARFGYHHTLSRYIKLSHDSCDSHEIQRYYKVPANIPSVLNAPPRIYVSQIMPTGGHFPKQQPIQVYLNKNANLKQPITMDYLQQHLYNFLDNYITRFRLQDQTIKVLYYVNDALIDMAYDPISHVLIYLTDRQQLKILSLLTNYEHVVSESISWFTYSPHHRLISMVMSKNIFCYCELLGTIKCVKFSVDILKSFVDFRNSRVFLLTTANILKIQIFAKDPTSLQPLDEVPEVSQFTVHDDNLYYLAKGQLMHRNLKLKDSDLFLIKDVTIKSLKLHLDHLGLVVF
ncbi:Vacuolar protein sorting/targeting protein VPS10 1 [Thelohanellus kitauei]|uniref:Vacuolar protein sorting/targeting protein VPS10 1 n=1 Tax=Thelohanellus kitauei TaxID=669202 RepID=A0A0C2IZP5_THEKT|nr:Vacuolar protein sorting/targeting protein VPS10 1 [Thelohanellus kitauei]